MVVCRNGERKFNDERGGCVADSQSTSRAKVSCEQAKLQERRRRRGGL